MKNTLIIGMGIGELYARVNTELGHAVKTVDPVKPSDFASVQEAVKSGIHFDIVHICTPNHTHDSIARTIATTKPQLVLVEKPGLPTAHDWYNLVTDFPETRWVMVKNNQYRNYVIPGLQQLFDSAHRVTIKWLNHNRVPSPGSWFTTRSQAWGGVSRDTFPHLLSWFTMFSNGDYHQAHLDHQASMQQWQLSDIESTDYGVINPQGVHDVDDQALLKYNYKGKKIILEANWRTLQPSDQGILFEFPDGSSNYFTFGLCPEEAYLEMTKFLWQQLDNNTFWQNELKEDLWIHQQLNILSPIACSTPQD